MECLEGGSIAAWQSLLLSGGPSKRTHTRELYESPCIGQPINAPPLARRYKVWDNNLRRRRTGEYAEVRLCSRGPLTLTSTLTAMLLCRAGRRMHGARHPVSFRAAQAEAHAALWIVSDGGPAVMMISAHSALTSIGAYARALRSR